MLASRSAAVFVALVTAAVRLCAQQTTASQNSFEEIKAKAVLGDLQAQVDAGEYLTKRGKDSEAFPWFMKAAAQGSPAAQLRLAEFYESGVGVIKDDAESQKWYRKAKATFEDAAERGDAKAMYQLGRFYDRGRGVPRSKTDAYKWYSVAASFGDAEAAKARGVVVRSLTSKELAEIKQKTDSFINAKTSQRFDNLRRAAEEGDGNAAFAFAQENSTRGDLAAAASWFRKAAEKGHAAAQQTCGVVYFKGQGVEQSYSEAAKWFQRAADQNQPVAQFLIAMCYHTGRGVGVNDGTVEKWLKKSAERGFAPAQYALGEMYLLGKQTAQNYPEAVKWFSLAAAQGHAVAQYSLGQCYEFGRGVGVNYSVAVTWFRRSAQQGNAVAQRELAVMFGKGLGTTLDEVEAYKWMSLAAAQEDEMAKEYVRIADAMMDDKVIAQARRRLATFVPQKTATTLSYEIVMNLFRASWDRSGGSPSTTGGQVAGAGTGFFISEDGYLLTNSHVVEDATKIEVRTERGSFSARLVKADTANDLAVLKIDGRFPCLRIVSSAEMRLGTTVFTVGFPNPVLQGFEPKLTKGEISSLKGMHDDGRHFQISVAVQPGNSGGALVDESGKVVGIVVARIGDLAALQTSGALPQNVNYAIKSDHAISLLKSVPDLAGKMPDTVTTDAKTFETVVQRVREASVAIVTR